jgi:PAS domain S-box-containing protein
MDVYYSPFFDYDRKVSAVVVSAHDITVVKELEVKLKDSEERFRAFMENTPGVIYIKDENDTHLYSNKFGLEVVGMKSEDFIGSSTQDVFPPKIAERLIELDRKVLKENIPRLTDEYSYSGEKGIGWYRDIKFPMKLGSGEKLLGGIVFDITEMKENEQKLQDAYNEIEQLKQKLEQENIYLREEIELRHRHEEIIGRSEPVLEMLARAEQVAKTDTTVLVLGETGTGKELIARSIHKLSSRKNRQMIKVNCAALPPTLIESELFGREKGAFTGAMTRQIGRFEIADGSTIFLDEIGELPLDVQAKLLRVLQEGQFERLGNPRTITVNVRIIASTNRDLARAVANGRFREDLYYRLNVFSVTAPPLRDRSEDIPLLVWNFVKEFEKSMGRIIEKIPQKSIDALKQYSWPGNIRELRNVVENAMIISTDNILRLTPPVEAFVNVAKDLKLEVVERNHIIDVLEKTYWRVSGEKGAAKLLGLKPTTLVSRMKKLGIVRPR